MDQSIILVEYTLTHFLEDYILCDCDPDFAKGTFRRCRYRWMSRKETHRDSVETNEGSGN